MCLSPLYAEGRGRSLVPCPATATLISQNLMHCHSHVPNSALSSLNLLGSLPCRGLSHCPEYREVAPQDPQKPPSPTVRQDPLPLVPVRCTIGCHIGHPVEGAPGGVAGSKQRPFPQRTSMSQAHLAKPGCQQHHFYCKSINKQDEKNIHNFHYLVLHGGKVPLSVSCKLHVSQDSGTHAEAAEGPQHRSHPAHASHGCSCRFLKQNPP